MALFVLLHSPSVGPATWAPVAELLRGAGDRALVPSLLGVAEGGPPFWPRVVDAVQAALAEPDVLTGTATSGSDASLPVVLVPHSNAGVFMPVVAKGLADVGRPAACCIFADATIPGPGDVTPTAAADFLPFLRRLEGGDGLLPRWTHWWSDADVAPLFPDQRTRELITGEQPRFPIAYFTEQVPAPAGWRELACGYLRFSAAYAGEVTRARELGWPVREMPGEHLHQVVDPAGVAHALQELTAALA